MIKKFGANRNMQELQFILENIFIIQPSPTSRYKIRVAMPHHNEQLEQFEIDKSKQIFKIPLRDEPIGGFNECGIVSLLELKRKDDANQKFLEIGKGEIDLSVLYKHNSTDEIVLNGIIYGTRSFNYGRIIAKYKYNVNRKVYQQNSTHSNQKITNLPYQFVNHKPKNKKRIEPILSQNKQIIRQSRQINQRLKELTQEMNYDAQIDHSSNKHSKKHSKPIESLRREQKEQSQCKENTLLSFQNYYYKYEQKFLYLLENSGEQDDFSIVRIKNVKINKENNRMLSSNVYLSDQLGRSESLQQSVPICLAFYEIAEKDSYKRQLLKIMIKIKYNSENNQLKNAKFFIPKSENRIVIQLIQLEKEKRRLSGKIDKKSGNNKIVELFQNNRQEGYLLMHVNESVPFNTELAKPYKRQAGIFQNIVSKYEFNVLEKCESKRKIKHLSLSKDKHYTEKEDTFPRFKNSRSDRKFSQRSQINEESLQTLKSRMKMGNPYEKLKQIRRHSRTEEDINMIPSIFDEKSKKVNRMYLNPQISSKSIQKESMIYDSRVNQRKVLKKVYNLKNSQKFKVGYRFSITNAYVNLYDEINGKAKYLRLEIDNKKYETRAIEGKRDVEWKNLNIQFDKVDIEQTMKLYCVYDEGAKKNENYNHATITLGHCDIFLNELKQIKNCSYRTFLVLKNAIVGYVILNYKIQRMSQVNAQEEQSVRQSTGRSRISRPEEYQLSISNSNIKLPVHNDNIYQPRMQQIDKRSAHEEILEEENFNNFRKY